MAGDLGLSVCRAPWTGAQVRRLENRQANERMHPYTCGTDSRHGDLVPTTRGWVCPRCDYVQDWAHASDAGRP